jgi:hypothetical protein
MTRQIIAIFIDRINKDPFPFYVEAMPIEGIQNSWVVLYVSLCKSASGANAVGFLPSYLLVITAEI